MSKDLVSVTVELPGETLASTYDLAKKLGLSPAGLIVLAIKAVHTMHNNDCLTGTYGGKNPITIHLSRATFAL